MGHVQVAKLEHIVQGWPTLLIHHGKILHRNLSRELMRVSELRMLLRRQGVHDLAEVAEAVLEPDGFISVVKKDEPEDQRQFPRSDVY